MIAKKSLYFKIENNLGSEQRDCFRTDYKKSRPTAPTFVLEIVFIL